MDSERPRAITVICVVTFVGIALGIPLIFSEAARRVGAWYPPYLATTFILGFVCTVGLWKMRKWGVVLYTALFAVGQASLVATNTWNVLGTLLPGIVIGTGFYYYGKMR